MELLNTDEPHSGSMPSQRTRAWGLTLFLLAVPLAGAGTSTSPDITDPANDIQFKWGLVNVASPQIDILAVWVEVTPSTVDVHFRVNNLSYRIAPEEGTLFALTFVSAEYDFAVVYADMSDQTWSYSFRGYQGSTTVSLRVTGEADLASNVIRVEIPRGAITKDMVNAKASSILGFPTPVEYVSGGNVWFRDWAPDDLNGPTIPIE